MTEDLQDSLPTPPRFRIGLSPRLRMGVRWARFAIKSLLAGELDFARAGLRAQFALAGLCLADLLPTTRGVSCNVCGWKGRAFYPNVGPGYDDRNTTCPSCGILDRHRALTAILTASSSFFSAGSRIVEVAPSRGFQAHCLARGDLDYTSFDLERYAMERGNILDMSYPDDSVDYFVCFHVLEHVPQEAEAVREIRRVLKTGGEAVLQVPMDWSNPETVEYDEPDPRDAFHVRQYGADFPERIARHGFSVRKVAAPDVVTPEVIETYGLSSEPVFFARKLPDA